MKNMRLTPAAYHGLFTEVEKRNLKKWFEERLPTRILWDYVSEVVFEPLQITVWYYKLNDQGKRYLDDSGNTAHDTYILLVSADDAPPIPATAVTMLEAMY